jgi:hypothetical protein
MGRNQETRVTERPTVTFQAWKGHWSSNSRNVTACADIAMTYPTWHLVDGLADEQHQWRM